jgi:hypothetical protein
MRIDTAEFAQGKVNADAEKKAGWAVNEKHRDRACHHGIRHEAVKWHAPFHRGACAGNEKRIHGPRHDQAQPIVVRTM